MKIYKLILLLVASAPGFASAANWGNIKNDGCVMDHGGVRKYSSRLWNISGDWDLACRQASATVQGQFFQRPHQCVNLGWGGMWGEWYVQDNSCKTKPLEQMNARWGNIARGDCPAVNAQSNGQYRKFYSRLHGIPSGTSWEAACEHWPIEIGGVEFKRGEQPAVGAPGFKRCVNRGGAEGIWGEFFVKDKTCNNDYSTTPASGHQQPITGDTLYGFADLHAHPFTNKGFGGRLFGSANGDIATAFAGHGADLEHQKYTLRSRSISQGSFLDLLALLVSNPTLLSQWDQGSGYPLFDQGNSAHNQDAWPRVWDSAHQQMHNVWVKRAAKGGLRLMVALAANADVAFGNYDNTRLPAIAHLPAIEPAISLDDWDALMAQTREAHIFAEENDWSQLSFNPDEARQAILAGKMSMVWGTEIDHAFQCKLAASNSPSASKAKLCTKRDIDLISQIHDMLGVRYVFPVHLKHNGLGYVGNNSPIAWNGTDNHGMETCQEGATFAGFSEDGIGYSMGDCGKGGLTELGKYAIKQSWRLGHIVDADHTSRKSHDELYALAKQYSVPLVRGHTGFFAVSAGANRHEGNVSRQQIKEVLDTGGMIGGIVFQGAQANVATYHAATLPNTCSGTSATWSAAYQYVKSLGAGVYTGSDGKKYGNLSFGTDFNGYAPLPNGRFQEYFFADQLAKTDCYYGKDGPQISNKVTYPFNAPSLLQPLQGETDVTLAQAELTPGVNASKLDYNTRGLATAGQLPDFFEDMLQQGLPQSELESVYRSAMGFADMWQRLSENAEESLHWFNPRLASEFSQSDYPQRRVPSMFINTADQQQQVCRIAVMNNGFSHYALGVVSQGFCHAGTAQNADYDLLSHRAHVGGYSWQSATASLSNGQAFYQLNQDNSNQRQHICRSTDLTGGVGVMHYQQGRQGQCVITHVASDGQVSTMTTSNNLQFLVAKAPMLARDS